MDILIEQRLAAVEIAVSELQRLLIVQPSTDGLRRFDGAFKDEPAFDEVIAYGRAMRETGDIPEGVGS